MFIILGSALAMSNALIGVKKLEFEKNLSKVEEEAKNIEIESINPDEDMLNNDILHPEADIQESDVISSPEESLDNETNNRNKQNAEDDHSAES